jgi:hypothetical protein
MSSYATKIYRTPKIGDVYTNNNNVITNIPTYPNGESMRGAISRGVDMGNTIYAINATNRAISGTEIFVNSFRFMYKVV